MSKPFDHTKPFVMRHTGNTDLVFPARLIATDFKKIRHNRSTNDTATPTALLVASEYIDENSGLLCEEIYSFEEDGTLISGNPIYELVNIPVKKSGWINIYEFTGGGREGAIIHDTKEKAIELARHGVTIIDTVQIHWEE